MVELRFRIRNSVFTPPQAVRRKSYKYPASTVKRAVTRIRNPPELRTE